MTGRWDSGLAGSPRQVLLFAVAVEGGMGILALVLGWILGLPVGEWIRWSAINLLLGAAGAGFMLVLLFLCKRSSFGPVRRLIRDVEAIVGKLFGRSRWWELLIVAVLAGWGEELLFRGVIQGGLQEWLAGMSIGWPEWTPAAIALAAGSMLFGMAHCLSREYVAFAFGVGLLLGGMALATGDLLAPVIAHAGYDFLALWILVRGNGGTPE